MFTLSIHTIIVDIGIVVSLYSHVENLRSKRNGLTIYCNSGIIGVRKQRND